MWSDTESAFDDGWPVHPRDLLEGEDASRKLRSVYDGGAGVVAAIRPGRLLDGGGRLPLL